MNTKQRNYFAHKNIEDFTEKIIIKPNLEGFPNRSFGDSRKLQGRSNIVNKHVETEKGSSINGEKPK